MTGLAGPEYHAIISFGLPFEPEDSQYGESRMNAVGQALDALEALGVGVYKPNMYFPPLDDYVALLETQGFSVTRSSHFERPTSLDGDEQGMSMWLRMFGWDYLSPLSPPQRDEVIAHVEKVTRSTLYADGTWTADYWRLRIEASKPV